MKTKSNKNAFKVIHYSIYPEDVLTIAKFVEIEVLSRNRMTTSAFKAAQR